MGFGRGLGALGGSAMLHAAVIALGFAVLRLHASPRKDAGPPSAPISDRLIGDSSEIGGGEEHVIDVDPPASPLAVAPTNVEAPKPTEIAPPAETSRADDAPRPKPSEPVKRAPRPKPKRPSPGDASASANARNEAIPRRGEGGEGGGNGGHAIGVAGLAAPRDLANAFTHLVPQACQGDGDWSSLATGDSEVIEIAIPVDDQGKLGEAQILTKAPPKIMLALVKRTMAALSGPSVFAMRDLKVSAGAEVLKVTALVGKGDTIGVVFDEYRDGKGKAHFTQASGARVDIKIEVEKIKN